MLFDTEGFPHCPDVSLLVQTELSEPCEEAPRLTTLENHAFEGLTSCPNGPGSGRAIGVAARRIRCRA